MGLRHSLGKMMRTKILLTLAVGIGLSLASSLSLRATTKVGELRCEFLKNPSGIDVTEPRLSWILESKQRGDRQTAYQWDRWRPPRKN